MESVLIHSLKSQAFATPYGYARLDWGFGAYPKRHIINDAIERAHVTIDAPCKGAICL